MYRTTLLVGLLIRLRIQSDMEYRTAFWLDRFAQVISYASAYFAIWLLVNRFDNLGGWTWPQLALLLSFQLLCYSIGAALSFVQLRDLEELVRLGTFDTLLVKPFSPWTYLVFSRLSIGYVGHVAVAIPLMGWSLIQVEVTWNPILALYFAVALISSSVLTAAIINLIGTTALIWVRSKHLFAIYFGFWELTRYPLNIFPFGLQLVLLTIVPMGYMTYVPISYLLGKHVPILGEWAGLCALVAGPLMAFAAATVWRYSMRRYEGGGG